MGYKVGQALVLATAQDTFGQAGPITSPTACVNRNSIFTCQLDFNKNFNGEHCIHNKMQRLGGQSPSTSPSTA